MRLSRYREGRALGTGDCDDVTTGTRDKDWRAAP